MIAILDYLKVDIEISDTGMEPMGSNNCRVLLGDNRDIISMLAVIWEKEIFSYKDKQKFINQFFQSISRLCWAS